MDLEGMDDDGGDDGADDMNEALEDMEEIDEYVLALRTTSADPNLPNFQSCLGRQSKFLTVNFSNKYAKTMFTLECRQQKMI